MIALSLLNKLPVIVLGSGGPEAMQAARAATGGTWPVFLVADPQKDMGPVCQVGQHVDGALIGRDAGQRSVMALCACCGVKCGITTEDETRGLVWCGVCGVLPRKCAQ